MTSCFYKAGLARGNRIILAQTAELFDATGTFPRGVISSMSEGGILFFCFFLKHGATN